MMNDPFMKMCIYRCSDYVFSCKQLPTDPDEEEGAGPQIFQERSPKSGLFSQCRLVFDLMFPWKLRSTKMSRICLLQHNETV